MPFVSLNRRAATGRLVAALCLLFFFSATAYAQSESIEYYASDALGSVRVVFDANGNILNRADFGPFGQELVPSSGKRQGLYAGLFVDGEAALDHADARSYQLRTGRFASVDPLYQGIFDPQKWNRYSYAQNNPAVFLDPSGLGPCTLSDGHTQGFCSTTSAPDPYSPWVWAQLAAWWETMFGPNGYVTRIRQGPTGGSSGGGTGSTPTGTPGPTPNPGPNPPGPNPPGPPNPAPAPPHQWIPSFCGGGGFGYAGIGAEWKKLGAQGEGLALVQYDSTLGGAHGGLLAGGFDIPYFRHFAGGFESMRTWSDWEAHTSPIVLGGKEIPGATTFFGRGINTKSRDIGGLAQYEDGGLSLGFYTGITLGSGRTFGGGGYFTVSWRGCR